MTWRRALPGALRFSHGPGSGSGSGRDPHHFQEDMQRLLHYSSAEAFESAYPPAEVTKVCLRLRYQIEQVIPYEIEEWKVTRANSPVVTAEVVATAKRAGGSKYPCCIVYCLLVCKRWFKRQAVLELWDADLLNVRAVACDVLAKKIIEGEEDEEHLMQDTLLRRYSILIRGRETFAANALERAVDLHALRVIGSSGYQRCINYIWRGWLIQDEQDPSRYVEYKNKANTHFWAHFHPDRMRTPQFQNAVQISVSILYLILYTIAINTINRTGDLDVVEGVLYLFTAGFILDELAKLWKDESCPVVHFGRYYIGFWNIFNAVLYVLLLASFITRMIALNHDVDSDTRSEFNILSYNFLAFSAPMFWMRLLLYLDTVRFLGAMLVILKVMMKESVIFFLLLFIICIGFLQAFIGMDVVDDNSRVTSFILQAMANSVMQSPDFQGFDNFAPPFGLILYYLFTFVVMVVLLNILIALYNSAYESVTDNADDEYMALYAQKTLQFVRAPDENVYIAPFNLIEIFCLILPFEWWMSTQTYKTLNDWVMGVLYSPLLLITAYLEARMAHQIISNRKHHEADDDTLEEWELFPGMSDRDDGWDGDRYESGRRSPASASAANSNRNATSPYRDADRQNNENDNASSTSETRQPIDFRAEGWAERVAASKPNINTDTSVLEVRALKVEVQELKKLVQALSRS